MKINYCLPIIKSKTDAILKIISENLSSYDFFEVWLDYIEDLDFKKLHPFCHSERSEESNNLKFRDPSVATLPQDDKCELCRKLIFLFRRQNLQTPKMDFKKRKEIMDIISESNCFLDLDISQKKELEYVRKTSSRVKLILSYHNYDKTPNNNELIKIVHMMTEYNPEIYKISTFCKSDSDAFRLIDLLTKLKEQNLKCIILGMGKKGIITRIAGAMTGNEISFAPLASNDKSAEGQLTKSELEKILKNIKICYFVADPVEHSLTPQMHEAGYKALGVDNKFLFLRHQVKSADLKKFIDQIKDEPNFRGASISIPHKVEIMKYLDEIEKVAKKIGAVNTIVKNGEKLKGYNTDCMGILTPLKQKIKNLGGKNAAIIGAGGAARAAVYALTSENIKVTVFNRDIEKAQKLASEFNCGYDSLNNVDRISNFDIIIHTTKVGMNLNDSPIIPRNLIRPNQTIFDVVYPTTTLIKQAAEQKAVTISGLEMLLYQGVVQFELFTNKKAPIAAMRKALI